MIVGCGDLTILLVGLGFHCFLLKCKEKLRHSLGRPSRSDFVQLEVADISAAFADYASAGYDVVIGHGYEFGDPALEVAETYPDTKFICTEADASADNVASYVMACEQTAYVEGIIAASTSESGKLGAIGPIPGDSLVKIINGYEDGAKSVNPDIEVQTAWTNSFVDTQLAQEAAKAMIENGNEEATPEWIEWAFKKADWYDPTKDVEDEYLGKRDHGKNKDEKDLDKIPVKSSWYW